MGWMGCVGWMGWVECVGMDVLGWMGWMECVGMGGVYWGFIERFQRLKAVLNLTVEKHATLTILTRFMQNNNKNSNSSNNNNNKINGTKYIS